MDDFYKEQILDHYKHPRNFGKLAKANATAYDNLVSCGDKLSMELIIKDNLIQDIKFEGAGCAISLASASMLTEFVKGKKISVLKNIGKNDILKLLEIQLSASRLKCAMLSIEVLKKAITNMSSPT